MNRVYNSVLLVEEGLGQEGEVQCLQRVKERASPHSAPTAIIVSSLNNSHS